MHIHHYTLRKIADLLSAKLTGGLLLEIFTQERDQLVVGIATETEERWLRIACAAPLPFVWPVKAYHKARRNVRDLFPELIGRKLLSTEVVPADRVLILHLDQGYDLVLKMHGLLSNVLVMQDGKVTNRFRHHHEPDLTYQPAAGPWDDAWQAKAATTEDLPLKQRLRAISPILERNFVVHVEALLAEGLDFVQAVERCLAEAADDRLYLLKRKDRIQFLLLPLPGAILFHDLELALSVFFRSWFQYSSYVRLYESTRKPLAKHLGRYRGQLDSFRKSIDKIATERPREEIGHLIMANMHQLRTGMESVELHDFYNDCPIKIKLRPELNPQQNAERYYNKQKKHKSRIRHLEAQIDRLESEMKAFAAIEADFAEFPRPQDLELTDQGLDYSRLKALMAFSKRHADLLASGKPHQAGKKHPFLEFERDGYTILVGKNAKQNDALTFHYSQKQDIWLHARDVQGSHVIVRNPGGQPLPVPVLEYAASLAALNSKRKHEKLVPVQYTARKYVRKLKGGAPGKVIVEREEVLMIEPAERR